MSKTKTHEEYITELKDKGIKVMPLESYRGTDTKILHRCECGNEWEVRPANVLSGNKCKECQRKSISQKLTMSHDEFIKKYSSLFNPNVKLVGKYRNTSTKLECECLICGETYYPLPDSLVKGHMHWKCAVKLAGMESRKTHEKFLKEVAITNPNVEIIGHYELCNIPVDCKCKVCGHKWSPIASSLTRGEGCPKCAGNLPITEEEFLKRTKDNTKVKILGKYVDSGTKIKCQCLRCGKDDIELYPYQIYRNVGCFDCAHRDLTQTLTKSHDEYAQQVSFLHPTITLLSEYNGAQETIACKCDICGHVWYPVANTLISQNTDCPSCAMSHGERAIRDWLNRHSIEFIPQMKFDDLMGVGGKPIPYDFYVPFSNVAIEYNGGQHETPVEYFGGEEKFIKQQEHDRRKREYAKQHGIKLLEIWYYDFDDIEKILEENLNSESVETVITA